MEEEDTYELAVMRAELLGMPAPDREVFEAARRARVPPSGEQEEAEREAVEAAALQEVENQQEELRGVSGGLEELTNILSITQTKLNRFKTVCGSIKNLFKLRDGDQSGCNSDSEGESTRGQDEKPISCTDQNDQNESSAERNKQSVNREATGDMNKVVSSQVDKLDSLLTKAENAQLTMQTQNKQMRSFLR
ncbi:hypothetical protein B566_EDAN007221 [Ephemera danica]|nr:hypothetical protein B566_EDAN007221 [Ephemera danica]